MKVTGAGAVVQSEAERAIRFIEGLKNPAGTEWAGQPLRLLEWQKDYITKLLGTVTPAGLLLYEKSLLFLPKKQGKTTVMASLALWFMFGRKHQQIICVANTKEQASLLYTFTRSMIEQNKWLSKRAKVWKGNTRRIEYEDSSLQVMASDAVNANGVNCSILLYDECCFAEKGELWEAIVSGGVNRNHILAVGISTAGFSTAGWGYELYQHAKDVAANPALDRAFLPVIYEAPAGADPLDIQSYIDCSPTFREQGSAAIRRIENMIKSTNDSPSELRQLERYHLNRWLGAEDKKTWIPIDKWDGCKETIPLETLAGKICYCGIDLASVADLTAVTLLFPLDDGRHAVLTKYYMPADNLLGKERRDSGAYYTQWAKAGFITTTPGDYCDYQYIIKDLVELRQKYQIAAIGIDRGFQSAQISQDLQTAAFNVVLLGQGWRTITPAGRELERLVMSKKLIHFGNPVLRWNVANCIAKVIDDAGNVRPSKAKSTGRIDGVYSLMDAIALLPTKQAAAASYFVF